VVVALIVFLLYMMTFAVSSWQAQNILYSASEFPRQRAFNSIYSNV